MNSRRAVPRFSILRSALFGGLLFAACQNDPATIDALWNEVQMGEDKAVGVTILYSKDARMQARLQSDEFVRAPNARPPFTEARKGVRIEFFNDSLLVESTLTARYLRWYELQNNILIRDNVVVVNKRGERMQTEELIWNQKAEKFFTEKAVIIKTPTQTIVGDGLEANQDFSEYEIKRPRGQLQVDKASVPGE